jgi:hypothetical protein
MFPKLLLVFIIIEAKRCLFDDFVHALDLSVGPRMSRLRQTMFRALFFANTVKNMRKSMYVADSVW